MRWVRINKEKPKFQFFNEDNIIASNDQAYEYLVSSSTITTKEYQEIYKLFKKNLLNVLPRTVTSSIALSSSTNSVTINWNNVPQASKYMLGVSLYSDLRSFIPNYNNTVVTGSTIRLTNLSSGTNYYYKLRTINEYGYGEDSKIFNILTTPAKPVVLAPLNVTSTSFVARWNSVQGAKHYKLDVSTNSNFVSYLPGYENRTIIATSQSVTGIPNGTTSYYRVRAENRSGASINSDIMSSIPIPAPVAIAATQVSATGFRANWNSVYGVTDYKLDVSTNPNFTNFVNGYNGRAVSGTYYNVSQLSPETNYYYRVRAIKQSGSSINSNTINTTTIDYYLLTITTVTPGRAKITINPLDVNGLQYVQSWATGTLINNGEAYQQPQSFQYDYLTVVVLTAQNDTHARFVKWQINYNQGSWEDLSTNMEVTLYPLESDVNLRAVWEYFQPDTPQQLDQITQEQQQGTTIQ